MSIGKIKTITAQIGKGTTKLEHFANQIFKKRKNRKIQLLNASIIYWPFGSFNSFWIIIIFFNKRLIGVFLKIEKQKGTKIEKKERGEMGRLKMQTKVSK